MTGTSYVVKNISKNIWKVSADSNVYLLLLEEPIVIDTGRRSNRDILTRFLDKVYPLDKVKKVIFTHLHYDHIGNFDLFKNAEFFASQKEIDLFNKDPVATTMDEDIANKFNVKLQQVKDFNDLYVINTPGHTAGSICLWYAKEKILFSGDTIFHNKKFGRVDLPTSVPKEFQRSVMKLIHYNFRILCPGHDY
jgi:glyoxylase-like metal-dependent hydrolase (beta-lactamase superfamily II)